MIKPASCFVIVFVYLLFMSCKKHENAATPASCTSTLYGFTSPNPVDTFQTCTFGPINELTATASAIATFTDINASTQAAFNTSDNCYHLLSYDSFKLYKIDAGGAITMLTYIPNGVANLVGISYNRATNNLYCIKYYGDSTVIAEITTTASTYSTVNVCKTLYTAYGQGLNSTVDNNTGDIYYESNSQTAGPYSYYIEKYHPGWSKPVQIANSNNDILGLCFNKNDNTLYGVIGSTFVKISSNGTISNIVYLGFQADVFSYSACIDPCSNRYIVTSMNDDGVSIMEELDIAGNILEYDTSTALYQGLAVSNP
jgi:hypothetical protein